MPGGVRPRRSLLVVFEIDWALAPSCRSARVIGRPVCSLASGQRISVSKWRAGPSPSASSSRAIIVDRRLVSRRVTGRPRSRPPVFTCNGKRASEGGRKEGRKERKRAEKQRISIGTDRSFRSTELRWTCALHFSSGLTGSFGCFRRGAEEGAKDRKSTRFAQRVGVYLRVSRCATYIVRAISQKCFLERFNRRFRNRDVLSSFACKSPVALYSVNSRERKSCALLTTFSGVAA